LLRNRALLTRVYPQDARFVMMLLDFIEGQELKDILHHRRRLPEEEASCLLLQAMRAVAYMHAQRVVHRDISPRNLLVTNAACLYVIDFGLAVDLEGDLSDVSAGAGTMGYQVSLLLH
jgi:serine/threonine protein kinase